MTEERIIRTDIVAVILLTFIVFLVAALATYDTADPVAEAVPALNHFYHPDQLVHPQNAEFQNACGRIGAWTSGLLINVLGVGAYFLLFGLVSLEIALFRQTPTHAPWLKTTGWMLSLVGLTTLASMILPHWTLSPIIGAGGYLGALTGGLLNNHFGLVGGLLLATSTTLVGAMIWTEYLVFRAGRIMFAPALVAATRVLPFGLLHGFMSWVNRSEASEQEGYEFDEDEDYLEDEVPEEAIAPRRIKIRSGNQEVVAGDDVEESECLEDESESEDVEAEDLTDHEEEDAEESTEEIAISESDDSEDEESEVPDAEDAETEQAKSTVLPKPHFKIRRPKKEKPLSERDKVMSELDKAAVAESDEDYELPTLELLQSSENVSFEAQKLEALEKAKILEKTCLEFGCKVQVVAVETGPAIAQYEIKLEKGLRLNKVTVLSDDLAIALKVPSVRIVAPLPNKDTVGVEVPNENRQIVRLRELMVQSEAKTNRMNIPVFLGSDSIGTPMVVDLAKLPHLLIAGRTGTGKSVCLNSIITSILMTRRPDEVRMLMIDPKMVELSGFGALPHLMHPVITDMRKAEAILAWAVEKMEDRYRLLAKAGVRHINSYNQLGEEELLDRLKPADALERDQIPSHLPFIVIIADEMADLMMTAGKEVEQHIIRLAQKSRAVGIHLILATQKPSVDVITGLIKSNLPARLAFQVASQVDSRVVLDSGGAEKLLGSGDMLFLWPGTSTLMRGQGTYLSDEEIDSITAAASVGEQSFVSDLMNIKIEKESDDSPGKPDSNRDDMYEKAVDVIVGEGRGSVSLLQRALGIGYGRAARIVDYMVEDGYLGAYNGPGKPREVLLTQQQWADIQNGTDDQADEEITAIKEEPALLKIEPARTKKAAANTRVAPAAPVQDDEYSQLDADEERLEEEGQDDDQEDDQEDEEYEYVQDDAEAVLEDEDEVDDDDEYEYEYEYEEVEIEVDEDDVELDG